MFSKCTIPSSPQRPRRKRCSPATVECETRVSVAAAGPDTPKGSAPVASAILLETPNLRISCASSSASSVHSSTSACIGVELPGAEADVSMAPSIGIDVCSPTADLRRKARKNPRSMSHAGVRTSAYDLARAEVKVAAPRYRWDFEFEDRQLEADYRNDEVKDVLQRRMTAWSVTIIALTTAWVVADAIVSSGRNVLYVAFGAAVSAVYLGTCAYAAAAARYDLPLGLTEGVLVCTFLLSSVAFTALLGRSSGAELFDVRTPTSAAITYPPCLLLQSATVLSLMAVFMPIRPVFYAVMALTPALATVVDGTVEHVAAFQRGGLSGGERLCALVRVLCAQLSFLALVLVLIVINAHISRVHRGAYHFYRSFEHGLRERQRLVRAEAEREAAKAARSRLIRMVMHDLRSPLLSVSHLAALLAETAPSTCLSDQEVAGNLRSLMVCSELMQNIISDMLDFERIESGRLVLVRAPFMLAQLLEAGLASFGGLAKAKGVHLHARPLAPSLASTAYIGDARRLQQCLNNGISNAIKFTEAGGSVTLRAEAEGPRAALEPAAGAAVLVEVRDTGCGLTAAELLSLNSGEAFTQVGRGQLQGSGGTGLGLSIVRQLVELHGPGSGLEVSSDGPGCGTSFRLHLELERAAAGSVPPRIAHQPSGGAPACAEPSARAAKRTPLAWPPDFRVLHVEDDAVLRRTMQLRVFRPLGVPFDVAEDGAGAVRLIAERREGRTYAVVIMDNQMPLMTGEAATRALRASGFSGVIIGMTGDPMGCPERNAFEAAGLNACYDKDRSGTVALGASLAGFALGPADATEDAGTLGLPAAVHACNAAGTAVPRDDERD